MDQSFVQFMREAKMPTSVTANTQPRQDLKRREYIQIYRLAYYHILMDLARAGYDTTAYDAVDGAELDRIIESELFSMRYDTYDAMPSRLDILVSPLHQVRSAEERNGTYFGEEPPSSEVWREKWRDYIHLQVDEESELPPRIYVHFACFPDTTVFKEKHFMAVLNNLQENRGITSKDTIVIITQNNAKENDTMTSRKIHLHKLNELTDGREGNFVIFFTIQELQYDLQSHVIVPPTRVIHCRREWQSKLKAVAYIEDPVEELPETDVNDAHMCRLFARPKQIVECLHCSENEIDMNKYHVVNYREQNY